MIAIGVALGGLVTLATGVLVVELLTRTPWWDGPRGVLTTLCLGLAVGVVLTSCAQFFWQEACSTAQDTFLLIDAALLLSLAFALSRQARANLPARAVARARPPLVVLLLAAVAVAGALVSGSFALDQLTGQAEQWDALAIWNLKALFLLRAGPYWSDVVDFALRSAHPDYPLLLPLTIARLWRYAGATETAWVPFITAAAFSAACVLLLGSAVTQLRGQAQGALAALALLAMPYFFQVGAWQYADIPLAFFELATVVCVIHAFGYEAQPGTARNRGRGAWILTGLCAGGALWTKDEGAIFVAALFVAIAGVGLWREPASHVLRRVSSVGLGLLPAVVALIALKVRHPFPNDIFGNLSGATVKRLFYLEWHAALLSQLRQAVSSSSDRIPMLLVLCYAVVAAAQGGRGGLLSLPSSERTGWAASALCLILLAGGLYCAYLISPHAIAWQVANSAERLRLQLLPSALFVGFVALPPAERVLGSGRR